jgi:hypothetical protein
MMIQLNPPLPLQTPKGEGLAHFLIDYSIEDNLYWVVFIKDTGECWTFSNPEIRACKNISIGRTLDKKSNKHYPPGYPLCLNT